MKNMWRFCFKIERKIGNPLAADPTAAAELNKQRQSHHLLSIDGSITPVPNPKTLDPQ